MNITSVFLSIASVVAWLSCAPVLMFAQDSESSTVSIYPQDYFRNPLNIPITLAGNFGECRPNHYHSGLDIKTEGRENLPVFAAASGYVSRIRISASGFGNALYITHPDGFTTLYAHLNNFAPAIQKYTKDKQYELETWAVDLILYENQFPVEKGDQIAWSGNTGSSAGPHLHFEIRETSTEHPLNPQLFGFKIQDTKAPVPLHLALYNAEKSLYEHTPMIIPLKGKQQTYRLQDTLMLPYNKLGMSVHVNDFMDGSQNTLNFYTASWYIDGILQGKITLDDIGYEETRYLHAYVDYALRQKRKEWFQCMFQLPGNQLNSIYSHLNADRGYLSVSIGEPANATIVLKDAAGNATEINFTFILTGDTSTTAACSVPFAYNKPNTFEHPNVRFRLSENDLYDNICFQFAEKPRKDAFSMEYQLHTAHVPIHGYFELQIKPDKPVPFALRDKIVLVYQEDEKNIKKSAQAARLQDGWYQARVRNFGRYYLLADTIAPVITPAFTQNAQLAQVGKLQLTVKDNLTSVASFRAELNGKWVCFVQRGNTYIYTFDEHCPKGKNTLKITVADENNNTNIKTYTFYR